MSPLRLLTTVGSAVALVVALGYITNSAATGWEYILAIPFAWFGFAFILSMGCVALIFMSVVLNVLMMKAREETRVLLYLRLRWAAVVLLTGAVLFWGGGAVVDGLLNNRLVDQKTLYARCMTPVSNVVIEEYRTCADGWASPSIGRRGACSHHGGVVSRWRERTKTRQNEPAFCRTDASNRSWIN